MQYENQIHKKIADEYEKIRSENEIERQKRIDEVYRRIPRIREIKETIDRAGADNIRRIFLNPMKKDSYNLQLREIITTLEAEKRELLLQYGIPLDYDKNVYRCEICCDTGYVNGSRCVCFKQKLISELYSMSNMEKILREQNFDTFDFSLFSNIKENNGISHFECIQKIYDYCINFCNNFDKGDKSLLFYGKTGTGKTFMSSCIAKQLIESGKTVVYTRASKLFGMYEDYKFGRSDEMRMMLERINCADFLIIDDLGTEAQNKNTLPFFLELINERIQNEKKMLISTNLTLEEMSRVYSGRFTSRVYEFFFPIHFIGEDIRIKKMKN